MLTSKQVEIIRSSANVLVDANISATNAFYANLFKVAPGVRPLFPEDMFQQSEKLWSTIVMVVKSASDLSEIESELRALGARHVSYGAEPAHYVVVTEVLIQTISTLMNGKWTEEAQQTWQTALGEVCALMLEGAAKHAA